MSHNFSFKFPDELAAEVEAEGERLKLTASEVIRRAVQDYFHRHQERQNFETLLYELIKLRAVVLRGFDMSGKELSQAVLTEAGLDAEQYLRERKEPQ